MLIDQTTALDPTLTGTLRTNVARLIKPGTAFTIATFSAFRHGHYTNVIASGTIEPPVPANERNRISVPKLKQLDRCLREQPVLGVRIALAYIARTQKVSTASFDQSEIMASLKQLSDRVARSRARDKVVIVASDMLEHSSATSFYASKGLKTIRPAAEIKKTAHLTANFGNARVYVIGGGILPPQSHQAGRTIAALDALEAFWRAWFKQSRGRLLAFGRPNLLSPIP
ncbi:MAG TPA: hypothetical protein VFZ91_05795 [Allosphingosinicella sp.]